MDTADEYELQHSIDMRPMAVDIAKDMSASGPCTESYIGFLVNLVAYGLATRQLPCTIFLQLAARMLLCEMALGSNLQVKAGRKSEAYSSAQSSTVGLFCSGIEGEPSTSRTTETAPGWIFA